MTGMARRPARSRPALAAQPWLPRGEAVCLRLLVKADDWRTLRHADSEAP